MYSLLWKTARPLLRRHKRLREDFAERLVPPAWPHSPAMQAKGALHPLDAGQGCQLWLQAASGGEAYLAWALLRELAGSRPELRVLCTTCTRQGLEVLQRAQLDPACADLGLTINYLPLDERAVTRRAVKQAFGRPTIERSLLVLLETEIWPGLLSACAEVGVRTAIVNARLTEGSYKAYRLLRPWLRRLAPAAILATAEGDLRRFSRIFDPAVKGGKIEDSEAISGLEQPRIRALMPNMKFDLLQPETLPADPEKAVLPPGGLLLLASTRQEEESALLEVIPQLLGQARSSALVLAPRHLHRIAAWREALDQAGLAHELRSSYGPAGGPLAEVVFQPGRVLLWDAFGELDRLYGLASAVFVGGSLARLGGQNFLEPLAAGLVPCIGPHWSNFYWAGPELFKLGLVRQVETAAELAPALLSLLHEARPKEEVKREFARYLAPRQGGARQAAQLILRLLGTDQPEAANG